MPHDRPSLSTAWLPRPYPVKFPSTPSPLFDDQSPVEDDRPAKTGRAAADEIRARPPRASFKEVHGGDPINARRLHDQRPKRPSKAPDAPGNGCRAAVMAFRCEPSEPAGKGPRGRRCRGTHVDTDQRSEGPRHAGAVSVSPGGVGRRSPDARPSHRRRSGG